MDIHSLIKDKLTAADQIAYQRDGALCLKQILTADEIDLLRTGIDYNLQHLSPSAKIASKPDDPGLFIEDFCTWQTNIFYKDFIFNSSLGAIAAYLMQSNEVRFYHDHLLVKEPGTRQRTPWHQDQPYYNIDGNQNCSFWIPVDPVSKASTLEFIAGSHRQGWLMPRTFMNNEAKWFPPGSLAELPDIDNHRDDYSILSWEIEPGDIVCFHMLSLHSAGGVTDENRRRVFSARFLGDDITHAPRHWPTSPDFPHLAQELPTGLAMKHPLFPLVWPKMRTK